MDRTSDDSQPSVGATGTAHIRQPASAWMLVHGLLPLVLPPLVIAAVVACYGVITSYRSGPDTTNTVLWSLVMMAVALSVAATVLAWYSYRCRLASVQRQLEELASSGRTRMISPEGTGDLAGLFTAMNAYVAKLRGRSTRLHLQKKELDIQTRITEAERRCIRTVVERVSEPVIVTDAFDEIVLVNRAAQEVFGFTLGGVHRQPIEQAISNPAMVQLIKGMRNPEEPATRTLSVRLNIDTARPQRFRISLTRVTDPRGHIHGVVTVLLPHPQPQVAAAKPARSDTATA